MDIPGELVPKESSKPPQLYDMGIKDPALRGVFRTFNLEEEFKVFLGRNQDVRTSDPDHGFLLFLIEQQRHAINNLELRVAKLEKN